MHRETRSRQFPGRRDFVVDVVDHWAKEMGRLGAPALDPLTEFILSDSVMVSDEQWDAEAPEKFDESEPWKVLEQCLNALDQHREISTIPPDEVAAVAEPIFTEVQMKMRCPWPWRKC